MNKHIILTLGRSGSNYLANLLNKHPNVVNYGEVLGDWTLPYKLHKQYRLGGNSVEEYLNYIYRSKLFFLGGQLYSASSHIRRREKINFKWACDVVSVGIKDFSLNFRRRGIVSYLRKQNDISVINLYRENLLNRLISLQHMKSTGVVSSKDVKHSSDERKKLILDIPYTLQKLEILEEELREHQAMIEELPQSRVLNISYESMFADKDSKDFYANKLFDFVGVPPIEVESKHRKLLSKDTKDIVENYPDLLDALRNTKFEKYLV